MTAIDLLNALKAYTEDKVKDMRLIARVPENGTDPGERPPLVFIGNLPNKEQEKKAAPYILLKLLAIKGKIAFNRVLKAVATWKSVTKRMFKFKIAFKSDNF